MVTQCIIHTVKKQESDQGSGTCSLADSELPPEWFFHLCSSRVREVQGQINKKTCPASTAWAEIATSIQKINSFSVDA